MLFAGAIKSTSLLRRNITCTYTHKHQTKKKWPCSLPLRILASCWFGCVCKTHNQQIIMWNFALRSNKNGHNFLERVLQFIRNELYWFSQTNNDDPKMRQKWNGSRNIGRMCVCVCVLFFFKWTKNMSTFTWSTLEAKDRQLISSD